MDVIAIDGPSGSGKSSVAQIVGEQLNFKYINSGAFYRAISVLCLENELELDEKIILDFIRDYTFVFDNGLIYVNNEDYTSKTRDEDVVVIVSKVSSFPLVRDEVNKMIRKHRDNANVILDGRDITTVVFPDATLKIYLDASVEIRAKRRHAQNTHLNYQDIYDNIERRDFLDSTRDIAPLTRADDAFYLDSSQLSIEEVVAIIIAKYEEVSK